MWVRGLSQRFIWYKHQALPGHLKQMKPCREENDHFLEERKWHLVGKEMTYSRGYIKNLKNLYLNGYHIVLLISEKYIRKEKSRFTLILKPLMIEWYWNLSTAALFCVQVKWCGYAQTLIHYVQQQSLPYYTICVYFLLFCTIFIW